MSSSAKAAQLTTPSKAKESGSLASFIEATPSARHLRVEADLGNGFYRLRIDEAERRQAIQDIRSSEDVLIELLRNARDAHARRAFIALSRDGRYRRIVLIDDGDGIPHEAHELVFEPRVTSKLDTMSMDSWGVHGRGMALYSISQNAVEAHIVASECDGGTAIAVTTNTDNLGERTDQSTFPSFTFAEAGTVRIRGPRNLLRTACEFALENRRTMTLYLASPAEIAATLYGFGCATVPAGARAFARQDSSVALCKRLAFASDERDFVERAGHLGLSLSERTARRILDGELASVPSLIERIEREGFVDLSGDAGDRTSRAAKPRKKRGGEGEYRAERRPRIDASDIDELACRISAAFDELADAYYLDRDVTVRARVEGDEIRCSIPLRHRDAGNDEAVR